MAAVLFFFLLVAACYFLQPALATLYVVGGKAGWTTPSRAQLDYAQWSASIPFKVGDTLEFNYVMKAHTVLEVIRSDFRYCNTSNPIASFTDGKTEIILSKPGNYYFIDGVGDHCSEGQKFQAKVIGTSTVASAPSSELEPGLAPASEPGSNPQSIPPATATASDRTTPVAMVMSVAWVAIFASKKWL